MSGVNTEQGCRRGGGCDVLDLFPGLFGLPGFLTVGILL